MIRRFGKPRCPEQGTPGLFFAVFLALPFLAACATVDARRLPALVATLDPPPPAVSELSATPYFPQVEAYCGPAALATVLQQRGFAATPDILTPQVYLPGKRGSLQVEMIAAARRQGALPLRIPPKLDAVLREVVAGNPVLVLQNLGLDWAPSWHYAVVIGHNLKEEEFILRSGPDPRMAMGFSVFDRTWTRGGRWALVLASPGEMPPTVLADEVASALAALERQSAAASLPHYRAAASRWPDDARFSFGLGNALYQLGDKAAAGTTWLALLQRFPEHVPALNNLASLRQEEGRLDEAYEFAARGARIAGPWQAQAQETLREVEKSLAAKR